MRIPTMLAAAGLCASTAGAQMGRAATPVRPGVPASAVPSLAVPYGAPSLSRSLPTDYVALPAKPGYWSTRSLPVQSPVLPTERPAIRAAASPATSPAVAASPRPTGAFEEAAIPGALLADGTVSAPRVGSGRAVNVSQENLSRLFDARRRSDARIAVFEEAPAPKAGVPAAAARVAEDFWREMSRLRAPAVFRLAKDEAPRLNQSLEELQGHDAYARVWRAVVDGGSPRPSDRRMLGEVVASLESLGRSKVVAVSDGGFWTKARVVTGEAGMQGPLLVLFEPGAVIDMAALIIPGPRPAASLHHLLHNAGKIGIKGAVVKAAQEEIGASAIRFSRGEAWFSEGSFHKQGSLLGRRAPTSLKALAAVWTARVREAFPPRTPRFPILAPLLTAFVWAAGLSAAVTILGLVVYGSGL